MQARDVAMVLGIFVGAFALGRASAPQCASTLAVRNTELLLCRQGQSPQAYAPR